MTRRIPALALLVATIGLCEGATFAQTNLPYGPPVTTETAKKVAAAALAEAKRNQWTVAAAIVDPSGELVYFEKIDSTQFGSNDIALEKARTAARFKRPSKEFEDVIAAGGGGLRMLAVPFVVNGQIVGAIGVSGGNNVQDGQCATAGAAAIK